MFRRQPSTERKPAYIKLDCSEGASLSAGLQRDPNSPYNDGSDLYFVSIGQFSVEKTPEVQMKTITAIWISIDTLMHSPGFTDAIKQHDFNFIKSAEMLRDYITANPQLKGRMLFRFLMCASICYQATLKADSAIIDQHPATDTANRDTLSRLQTIIALIRSHETRPAVLNDSNIHIELAGIEHIAARHLSSCISFLQSAIPYFEDMKTRLLCIKTSMPQQQHTNGRDFFSPHIEDWQSEIDATLISLTDKSRKEDIITAYEITLNILLDTNPPKNSHHFAQFKSLLDDMTLTKTVTARAAIKSP